MSEEERARGRQIRIEPWQAADDGQLGNGAGRRAVRIGNDHLVVVIVLGRSGGKRQVRRSLAGDSGRRIDAVR